MGASGPSLPWETKMMAEILMGFGFVLGVFAVMLLIWAVFSEEVDE